MKNSNFHFFGHLFTLPGLAISCKICFLIIIFMSGCHYTYFERQAQVEEEYVAAANDFQQKIFSFGSNQLISMFFQSTKVQERLAIINTLASKNENFDSRLLVFALDDYYLISEKTVSLLAKINLFPIKLNLVINAESTELSGFIRKRLSQIIIPDPTSNVKLIITVHSITFYQIDFIGNKNEYAYLDPSPDAVAREVRYELLKQLKDYLINTNDELKRLRPN